MRSLVLFVVCVMGLRGVSFGFESDRPPFFPVSIEVKNDGETLVVADWGACDCQDEACKTMPHSQDVKAFEIAIRKFAEHFRISADTQIEIVSKRKLSQITYRLKHARIPSFVLQSSAPTVEGCGAHVALEVWTLTSSNTEKVESSVLEMISNSFVVGARITDPKDLKVNTYASKKDKGASAKIFFFDAEFQLPEPIAYTVPEGEEVVAVPFIQEVNGKVVETFQIELRKKKK